MTRRIPLTLVLVWAGIWGGVAKAGQAVTGANAPTVTLPILVGADVPGSGTLIRSGGLGVAVAWDAGSTPVMPSTSHARARAAGPLLTLHLSQDHARFRAARAAHRGYATPSVLARAGILSSPPTAPPRFRFV